MGGAGNDVLIVNASNISSLAANAIQITDGAGLTYPQLAHIDGGSGIDVLRLTEGAHLNLSNIRQISTSSTKVDSRISSI